MPESRKKKNAAIVSQLFISEQTVGKGVVVLYMG